MIKSENGQLVGMVFIDVRDRDVGSYVAEAQRLVEEEIVLPAGYRLEWSGQYEAMERVKARLMIVVPITLGIIALLLYFNFFNLAEVGIVMFSLPFALVGGVMAHVGYWTMIYLGSRGGRFHRIGGPRGADRCGDAPVPGSGLEQGHRLGARGHQGD